MRDAASADTTMHPTAEDLAAYLDGSPDARARVAAHVAECDECLATVAAVMRQRDEAGPPVPAALLAEARARGPRAVETRQGRSMVLPGLAVAASLVLAVAVWGLPGRGAASRSATAVSASHASPGAGDSGGGLAGVRSEATDPARPIVLAPTERAVVQATPLTIRWTAVADAAYYTVRLTADDGSLVWQEHVTDLEVTVPAGVPLAPDRAYFILLSASLPGNRRLAPSATRFYTPPAR